MLVADTLPLLAAIRAHPHEDTPRLALADLVADTFEPEAGDYIRRGIEYDSGRVSGRRPARTLVALSYVRWLEALLFGPDESHSLGANTFIGGSAGWDHFFWNAGYNRRAELFVRRGLPVRVRVTAPLLVERPKKLFLFPLTECRVIDRRPSNDMGEWLWQKVHLWPSKWNTWEDTEGENACMIPPPLFEHLARTDRRNHGCRWYDTAKLARDALDAAALEFGRRAIAGEPTV